MRRFDRWTMAATLVLFASAAAHAQAPPARPAPPPRVVSPEVAADGKVTFRVRAPQAQSVRLTSGGDLPQIPPNQTLELAKGGDGVWQLTIGPVDPGAYRYAYSIDGVSTVDPAQASISPSNDSVWSLFTVSGSKFMDTRDVPHGAVAEVPYFSKALGKWRRMHVYTPPGYGLKQQRYPVLYLLHGAFDSDGSWPTVGRAGDIVDNLIAEGSAVPMVVVMPAGHTGPFTMGGGAGGLPIDEFVRDFQGDIKPYVESHYTVRTDRKSTAIAGLSMGGAQTLELAAQRLQDFGYVGVFSSGVFSVVQNNEWETRYKSQLDDSHAKSGLALLWFATGKDDFLLDTTKATVALFQKHGFKPVFRESTGGHTWINWRDYLHEFTPQLFK